MAHPPPGTPGVDLEGLMEDAVEMARPSRGRLGPEEALKAREGRGRREGREGGGDLRTHTRVIANCLQG